MVEEFVEILLVDDKLNDVGLTLHALKQQLARCIEVVRDCTKGFRQV